MTEREEALIEYAAYVMAESGSDVEWMSIHEMAEGRFDFEFTDDDADFVVGMINSADVRVTFSLGDVNTVFEF